MSAALSLVPAPPARPPALCAITDCPRDSVGARRNGRRGRGLNAYCPDHKAQRIGELADARVRASILGALDAGHAGVYEQRARVLALRGRQLDEAIAAELRAIESADRARARWQATIRALSRSEGAT